MAVKESDLRIAAMQLLAKAPGGFIATEKLIPALADVFKPEGIDVAILDGRSDTHFSQKVRNLVSHRDQPSGLVGQGHATYNEALEGLQITDAGRAYLTVAGLT
jgi:hypothetical protein